MDVIETLTARERLAVKYALSLLSSDTYFRRFYAILSEDTKPSEAFRALEREVKDLTGRNRYQDFETFRQMRHRYCRRIMVRRGNP